MNLVIQSSARFITEDGGDEAIGPIIAVGSITPAKTYANLASGNNSFTPPSGAIGAVISPPAANLIVLKVKTTSGDTGIAIPAGRPSVVFFDSTSAATPATLYINAASATTGNTVVTFF